MTRAELIAALEKAEGPKFSLFVDAWHTVKTKRITVARDRFISLAASGAYFEAAVMLVPNRYSWHINSGQHIGGARAYCIPEGPDNLGIADPRKGEGFHPSAAIALAIAACIAHGLKSALKARE